MKTLREYIEILDEISRRDVNEGLLDKAKNAVGWLQDLKGQVPSRAELMSRHLQPQYDLPKPKPGLSLKPKPKPKTTREKEYELAKIEAEKGIPTQHFIDVVKQLQAKNLSPAEIGYTIWGPDGGGAPHGLRDNFSSLDYIIVGDLDWDSWDDLGKRITALAALGTTRIVKPYDKWGNEKKLEEAGTDAVARVLELSNYK